MILDKIFKFGGICLETDRMHCDTLLGTAYGEKVDLYENKKAVDFKRMKAAGFSAQFFAMCLMPEQSFAEKGLQKPDDMEFMTALSDCLYQNLEKYSDVAAFAGNRDDLVRNEREGKLSCFLTAEDGNGIGGKREGLEKMYQMGVRLISITWNMENCLGYPNSFDPEKMALPLKPFGCEMVDAMNKMGVIVDVSHLSDGGFWDVVRICKENHKPFVASHSACRALTPHSRNLTDEMIRCHRECRRHHRLKLLRRIYFAGHPLPHQPHRRHGSPHEAPVSGRRHRMHGAGR